MLRRRLLTLAWYGGMAALAAPALAQPKGGNRRRGESGSGPTVDADAFLKLDGRPEDEGFAALLQKLRATPGRQTVRFPGRGGVLNLSGTKLYDLPDGVRWDFGKTVTRLGGPIKGNGMLFTFGQDSEVLGLNMELPAGSTCDRLVGFGGRSFIDRLQIVSENQLANGGDNADALVQVRGSEVEIVAASISGVDRPMIVFGAGATAQNSAELSDVRITDLRVRNFVTGLRVRNVRDCRITGYAAAERSRNAKQDPGHNAILIGHVQGLVLDRFTIDDAGEHAVRIGGSPNLNEIQSRDIKIQEGRIRRPGKCGVKFWSGGKSEDERRGFTTGVEIRRVATFDCGYGGKLSVNENAVHLEAVEDFVIDGLTANPEKSAASCHDVIFLAGCSRGRIQNVNASAAARSVLWMTETIAKTMSAPVRSIQGSDIRSNGHRGDFIHLEMPELESGPFEFRNLQSSGGANFVGGEAPRLAADSRFDGVSSGHKGALNALANNRRIKVNAGRG